MRARSPIFVQPASRLGVGSALLNVAGVAETGPREGQLPALLADDGAEPGHRCSGPKRQQPTLVVNRARRPANAPGACRVQQTDYAEASQKARSTELMRV